jgi:hypothetical protein
MHPTTAINHLHNLTTPRICLKSSNVVLKVSEKPPHITYKHEISTKPKFLWPVNIIELKRKLTAHKENKANKPPLSLIEKNIRDAHLKPTPYSKQPYLPKVYN